MESLGALVTYQGMGEIFARYDSVDRKLQERSGEEILVVREEVEPYRPLSAPIPGRRLYFGVLAGNPFREECDLVLPMEQHASKGKQDWKREEGPIRIALYHLSDFREDRSNAFSNGPPLSSGLWVFAGDEVRDYFSASEFGRRHLDLDYARALELLGLQVPEPFAKAYEDALEDERDVLVRRMELIVSTDTELEKRIRAVEGSSDARPVICRDEAVFITWKEHAGVRDNADAMRRYLARADELGLESRTLDLSPGIVWEGARRMPYLKKIYVREEA